MAATTIKSLTERILRIVNLGDVPEESRFNFKDVSYMVRDSLGKQIAASWFAARNTKEALDISDSFISTVTKTVQADAKVETTCFVDLDFDWVDLPDSTGIQSIRPAVIGTLGNLDGFIPAPARFNDIYRGLPAKAIEQQIAWQLRGKRAYFTEKGTSNLIELGVTTVEIDVISTSEILVGLEKALPIPPNIADLIIKEVAQFFLPLTTQGMKDMLADGNSNNKPLAP
jgi:hypothetical protein